MALLPELPIMARRQGRIYGTQFKASTGCAVRVLPDTNSRTGLHPAVKVIDACVK